jgi:hypothetical protein
MKSSGDGRPGVRAAGAVAVLGLPGECMTDRKVLKKRAAV